MRIRARLWPVVALALTAFVPANAALNLRTTFAGEFLFFALAVVGCGGFVTPWWLMMLVAGPSGTPANGWLVRRWGWPSAALSWLTWPVFALWALGWCSALSGFQSPSERFSLLLLQLELSSPLFMAAELLIQFLMPLVYLLVLCDASSLRWVRPSPRSVSVELPWGTQKRYEQIEPIFGSSKLLRGVRLTGGSGETRLLFRPESRLEGAYRRRWAAFMLFLRPDVTPPFAGLLEGDTVPLSQTRAGVQSGRAWYVSAGLLLATGIAVLGGTAVGHLVASYGRELKSCSSVVAGVVASSTFLAIVVARLAAVASWRRSSSLIARQGTGWCKARRFGLVLGLILLAADFFRVGSDPRCELTSLLEIGVVTPLLCFGIVGELLSYLEIVWHDGRVTIRRWLDGASRPELRVAFGGVAGSEPRLVDGSSGVEEEMFPAVRLSPVAQWPWRATTLSPAEEETDESES